MKKHSRKRDAILEKIRAVKTHPSAEWVYAQLKPEYPDLSLATVYRNIAEFLEEGLLISVGVVNGQARYDGTTEEHAHFICDQCGAVIDVDCSADNPVKDRLDREYGVKTRYCEMTFRGLCPQCAEGAGAKTGETI